VNSPFAERVGRLRAVLRARKLDAFLVTGQENRRYLSGFSAQDAGLAESAGALLILPAEALLFTDGRYETQAAEEALGWRCVIYKQGLARALKGLLAGQHLGRMAYEPESLTCHSFHAVQAALPDTDLCPLAGRIEAMRTIKASDELERIKDAIAAAELVLDSVWHEIRPGVTEREVAWKIIEGLWRHADGPSFPPIVASGPNAARPHAEPTSRPIGKGEPVIIDMGARLAGYCSDMTRTFFSGKPAPPFDRIYRLVQKAKAAAQRTLKPGVTGAETDAVARDVIARKGFGPRFLHGLGHGVGLAVHEAPRLSPRGRRKLRAGMVVTVEPGIYLPGQGGVRLEDMVAVEAEGARMLNQQRWYYDL